MYRIIWLDIDGTLRDEQLGIPKSAAKAIQLCRENRCSVVLCTGRTKACITDDVLALPVDGIIAGGGCYVEYRGEIIQNRFFSPDEAERALEFLSGLGESAGTAVETAQGVWMNEAAAGILKKQSVRKSMCARPLDGKFIAKAPEKIRYLNNLEQLLKLGAEGKASVSKLCLWSSEEIFKAFLERLSQNSCILAQQEAETYFGGYYEMVQRGCDKGTAIRRLCRFLGIEPEHTIAFGDGGNDIAMFKAAGVGIAMGNGCRELTEIADSVCGPLTEDGLYLELKRRNLI